MKKKIVLCGGGTAGHVYPALAVAEKLTNFEIHYFGSNGMEKEILKDFPNITYHEIPSVKLVRKLTFKNLLIPVKLFGAIRSAKCELEKVSPDVIFSKGGYVSLPVAIASKKLGIPLVSHESDLSFGLANKIILHYATVMCTSFEKTGKKNKKCVFTGQPIRQKIFEGKKQYFSFSANKPTVLVLGGSLGAKFLNDIVFDNLKNLTEHYNILHICGKKNFQKIVHKNYQNFAYAENIEDLYASADIVVSRAGSGVINELLALQKPMLLVPLSKKASRGDQIENAKYFFKKGYCEMLEEESYSYPKFLALLENLSKNSEKFKKNMQKSAKNNASEQIFEILNSLTKKEKEQKN